MHYQLCQNDPIGQVSSEVTWPTLIFLRTRALFYTYGNSRHCKRSNSGCCAQNDLRLSMGIASPIMNNPPIMNKQTKQVFKNRMFLIERFFHDTKRWNEIKPADIKSVIKTHTNIKDTKKIIENAKSNKPQNIATKYGLWNNKHRKISNGKISN